MTMFDLPTLGWPRCPYCTHPCDLNSVGYYCHCDGWQQRKQASAEAMRDRMVAGGWQGYDDGLDGNGNMRLEEKV
jgi:hypothetical protein